MPSFYIQILERDGSVTDNESEFHSVEEAKAEAYRALANVAADGLPTQPLNMVSVEVLDDEKRPIWEARLLYEEIDKTLQFSIDASNDR